MDTMIEQAERIRRGEQTARAAADEALAKIERLNGDLNAFVAVDAKLAHEAADRVDAMLARGEDPGPLCGVPCGVKDQEPCAGFPLTFGCQVWQGRGPEPRDSIHVARLRAAGAVPIGMTASPEFGAISWTRSRAHGVTRSPWNLARTPGGSSGGSASAVAAGIVAIATAGDGGGSTRIPAAYTGLVGHKASYGRIPKAGANTSQTAVSGCLVTSVADAARHLDVACGPDDRDRTSLPAPGLSSLTYERAIEELDVRGLKCMYSPDLGFAAVDPEVHALCAAAADRLIDAAGLERAEAPLVLDDLFRPWSNSSAIDVWLHVEKGEWPERAADYGGNIRKSLEVTERLRLPWYVKLLRSRTALEARVADIYDAVDVLITPTTAIPAHVAEGPPPPTIDGREASAPMAVPFTMLANLCWNPATSVPAGLTKDGLPVGLQIMTRRHADEVALRLARIAEQANPWPRHAPGY